MESEKLERLLDQLERLAQRAEALLPPKTTPDWSAMAYRYRAPGHLQAILHPQLIELEDLLHIERQKRALLANTERFLTHNPCNHVLLWGSRGTGKSSLIRAVLQRYSPRGLRVIEVARDDLVNLPDIVAPLTERPERFILYSDDLSFEANEPSYKALKAMLDGSLAGPPHNVLIHATSNRRHLMPEALDDNLKAKRIGKEIHPDEAVEEKISLSERFGLWLSFQPFNQTQYLEVVHHWLTRLDLAIPDVQAMEHRALQFALERGSRSGRIARQFANQWHAD